MEGSQLLAVSGAVVVVGLVEECIFLPFCFPFSMGYMILSPPKRGSIFFLYKEKTNSENYKRKLM